jgi:large subunit ribosomal protein L3
MAGQLGHQQVTTMNLKVVDVLADRNLLLLRGAVPGARNGVIYIRKTNRVR